MQRQADAETTDRKDVDRDRKQVNSRQTEAETKEQNECWSQLLN